MTRQRWVFSARSGWTNRVGAKAQARLCSGHACFADIKAMIEGINARKVVPVHTENAGMFEKFG